MKKLLTILALSICTLATAQTAPKEKPMVVYDWKINRVVDGDTVEVATPWVPDPIAKKMSIRVFGVDTPEKGFRGQCDSEKQRGEAASVFTKGLINASQQRQVVLYGWDKFGGRVLGDIILNGQSLRAQLIANGFAREYYGEAKQSWCN